MVRTQHGGKGGSPKAPRTHATAAARTDLPGKLMLPLRGLGTQPAASILPLRGDSHLQCRPLGLGTQGSHSRLAAPFYAGRRARPLARGPSLRRRGRALAPCCRFPNPSQLHTPASQCPSVEGSRLRAATATCTERHRTDTQTLTDLSTPDRSGTLTVTIASHSA